MTKLCEGRVVIVTGAGRGLGREHALEFARQGARVVVNDLGSESDGSGSSIAPGAAVVEEIVALGGEAVVNGDDVASWAGAERLIGSAIEHFGRLDVLVNNAGILRDRMLVNMGEEEWDAVIRVHLRGHFCPTRHAAAYWRERAKTGEQVDARIINTSSGAGLLGSIGQSNYVAAKAGILGLTVIAAAELARYGVTVNAIAPSARTRLTEGVFPEMMAKPEEGFDRQDPGNVAPLVVWLASTDSAFVTGRVFEVEGGMIGLADGWQHGPTREQQARWDPSELGPVVRELVSKAPPPAPVYGAAD